MRPTGSPEILERRRRRTIALLKDGLPSVEVAKKLKVDRRSVRRRKASFSAYGPDALQAKPAPDRPPRLNTREKAKLEEQLFRGAIAAPCISPQRDLVSPYFRPHPDANVNCELVLQFLKHLRKQLKNHPLILVWDGFLAHQAKKAQSYITNSKILSAQYLPSCAPELNPLENVWTYLKMNPLAKDPRQDVSSLAKTARYHGRSFQHQQLLLRSFAKHTPLSLRLI